MIKPVYQTERFDIFRVQICRNPELGAPRDLFTAWARKEDLARSLCEVTIFQTSFGNYVEWLHVDEQHRRVGIATEVLSAIEDILGGSLEMVAASESGEAFIKSYCGQCENSE